LSTKTITRSYRKVAANEFESITLPNGMTQELGPIAHDAFAVFENLCLLSKRERGIPSTRVPLQDL
jgi:hypothetical protein